MPVTKKPESKSTQSKQLQKKTALDLPDPIGEVFAEVGNLFFGQIFDGKVEEITVDSDTLDSDTTGDEDDSTGAGKVAKGSGKQAASAPPPVVFRFEHVIPDSLKQHTGKVRKPVNAGRSAGDSESEEAEGEETPS